MVDGLDKALEDYGLDYTPAKEQAPQTAAAVQVKTIQGKALHETLGKALHETLNKLIQSNVLPPEALSEAYKLLGFPVAPVFDATMGIAYAAERDAEMMRQIDTHLANRGRTHTWPHAFTLLDAVPPVMRGVHIKDADSMTTFKRVTLDDIRKMKDGD